MTAPTPPPDESLTPTTMAEQDRYTAGQRRINIVWELTQAFVALSIVGANIAVVFATSVTRDTTILENSLFLIIGFYFGRTNHLRPGGVGGVQERLR